MGHFSTSYLLASWLRHQCDHLPRHGLPDLPRAVDDARVETQVMFAVMGGVLLAWLVMAFRQQIVLLCWLLLVTFIVTMGVWGASQEAPTRLPAGVVRVER